MNVEKAWSAFASGDWGLAKSEFEAAAERDPSPEVIDGLGRTLWWLKDVTAAIEVRTTAYGAYRRANKLEQAAHVAVWLALTRPRGGIMQIDGSTSRALVNSRWRSVLQWSRAWWPSRSHSIPSSSRSRHSR